MNDDRLIGGDFRILEPLGKGRVGEVYVAEQLSTWRKRALKLMSPLLVAAPEPAYGPAPPCSICSI